MSRFNRRTVLLILGALIILSLVVRYPLVEHERHQTDSYFIHALAQSVVNDGYATWTFHALSYLGYYPFSYPSGVPFVLAEMSSMTGLSVELCVLMMNMAFAVIFCLAVFGLSRKFLPRSEHALLATFFAVLASRFVDTSYWVASARGPLVVMMVLIVFVSFQTAESRRRSYWLIALMFIFSALVIHHMAVLLTLFGLGFVVAAMEAHYLLPKVRALKRSAAIGVNVLILLVVALVAFGFLTYFRDLAVSAFTESDFFDIDLPVLSVLVNAGVSYSNQVGFILVFAVIGSPFVLLRHRLDTNLLFLVVLLIVFVPMINSSIYVSMVITPFVAILGTRWVVHLHKTRNRALISVVVIALLASSIVLPVWSCDRWNSKEYVGGNTIEVDSQLFSDAAYLRVSYEGISAMSNTNDLSLQMRALTNTDFLGSGIYLAINGDVVSRDVHRNVTWSSRDFPVNLYVWFEYMKEPNVDYYILGSMMNGFNFIAGPIGYPGMHDYFSNHQKVIVLVDNNWPSNSVSPYSILQGTLMPQLENAGWQSTATQPTAYRSVESYSTYQSEGITLYMVNLPLP